jgi:hypothetical protein
MKRGVGVSAGLPPKSRPNHEPDAPTDDHDFWDAMIKVLIRASHVSTSHSPITGDDAAVIGGGGWCQGRSRRASSGIAGR